MRLPSGCIIPEPVITALRSGSGPEEKRVLRAHKFAVFRQVPARVPASHRLARLPERKTVGREVSKNAVGLDRGV